MNRSQGLWKGLWSDPLARAGLLVIVIFSMVAIAGAYLRPDSSSFANEQHLALARSAPGTEVKFFSVAKDVPTSNVPLQGLFFGGLEQGHERYPFDSVQIGDNELALYLDGHQTYRSDRIAGRPLARLSHGEAMQSVDEYTEHQTFVLGTDSFGRDMLSRLMGGSMISLSVGFISVLISLLIGITLGAIAGYFRGVTDGLIMWLINVIWSIPTLLMVIAITLVMGKGFVQVFIAVGLTMWVEVARVVRGQFLSIRELPYLEAGRSMGYSSRRLIFKHMLPNAMGPVIVISAANFASAILIEAGLSFLGIGTQIPMPSWGGMIKEHYAYITTDMAYLAILPGICITLLVLSLMLIGNRLRDILDVRTA
ncbi:MAG: ABC transporter permease [Flavobacteriales bacterium]|nr:ABC transporter permease [Flavobacteriales bacterium]